MILITFNFVIIDHQKKDWFIFVHFLGPFELIDGNGDGNITRNEWQEKIELAMDKVMDITNVTMVEDYEDFYDNTYLGGPGL